MCGNQCLWYKYQGVAAELEAQELLGGYASYSQYWFNIGYIGLCVAIVRQAFPCRPTKISILAASGVFLKLL